ncbi:MAG: HaeIII family restriction endonuclease [Pedobacter sp.]|nr:HaeIII family restriction endonuclease [Chitinophagaceae bacterium]
MTKDAKQTKTGKAFEYAVLNAFLERLKLLTKVLVVENKPYLTSKKHFNNFNEIEQGLYNLNASFAVNFLIDLEPRLSNGVNTSDILQLEIVPDKQGQSGDVRDVLAIRSLQKWEIGVSAKNNHRAVKHQRLSTDLDFGKQWIGISCSMGYFESILPIFNYLEECKKLKMRWKEVPNKSAEVYVPVLQAFVKEIEKLNKENPEIFPQLLVKYLVGNKDFYKVIKRKKKVEIQAFNLYGGLNLPFDKIKSKYKISKVIFPDRLIEIAFKKNSKTTVNLVFNEGWQFSFRLHSAEGLVVSSLKFDVNLVSAPHSLFVNHLSLG